MNKTSPEEFVIQIKKKMASKGIKSGAELARLIGVERATVSHWLRGRHLPTGDNLTRLTEVLECNAAYLVRDQLYLISQLEQAVMSLLAVHSGGVNKSEAQREAIKALYQVQEWRNWKESA